MDRIPGVRRSHADCTGRDFLIELEAAADVDAAAAAAMAVLGAGSARHSPEAEAEQAAGFGTGDLWMDAGSILTLSLIEARILARRKAEEVAADAGLDEAVAAALGEILRQELTNEFRRVHGCGGSEEQGWQAEPFRAAYRRALERAAASLSDAQREALARREF
jgi:hypothetical protein